MAGGQSLKSIRLRKPHILDGFNARNLPFHIFMDIHDSNVGLRHNSWWLLR